MRSFSENALSDITTQHSNSLTPKSVPAGTKNSPSEVGITTLLFLKIRLYFVGNLSNFDKLLIIKFVLACTYSNGQHDPLPPTAEAAQLIQQRRHTIITKHRQGSQWDRHSKRQKHPNKRLGATQFVRTKAELQDWKGARTLINTGQKTQRDASASA
jgi:hypothetical protein